MILDLVMQNKYGRKDFLRMALLGNLSLLVKPLQPFAECFEQTLPPSSNEHVTYVKKGDAAYDLLRKGFNK
ncbi:MAG TPA: hypothetical protein VHL77_07570, partial [Ferruginibacter sp.]|nr:hypothetical protein [Ferruginibacter sp.]